MPPPRHKISYTIYAGDKKGFKGQLDKVNIELMQKKRSDVYHRKLKQLLENFSQTREHIAPLTKKELLQFVFKDISIKNKLIVKITFYQPFSRYWEDLKCNINQVMAISSEKPYILLPTGEHWPRLIQLMQTVLGAVPGN